MGYLWLLSGALLYYTLKGYPLWMAMRCGKYPRREYGRSAMVGYSIVVVSRNGGEDLKRKMAEILSYRNPTLKKIVVVDDGSEDGSVAFLTSLKDPRLEVLSQPRGGKSRALNKARSRIKTEAVVLMDVRQSVGEDTALSLKDRLHDDFLGGISARLRIPGADTVYWEAEWRLRDAEGRQGFCMGLTGACCALKTRYWEALPDNCLCDDMALGLMILSKGALVDIDPDLVVDDPRSIEWKAELIRKIRTLSGNWQILLGGKSYPRPKGGTARLALWSHKWLRLFLPVLTLSFLILTLVVWGWIFPLVFLGAGAFIGFKLGWRPKSHLVQPFLYLNLAALIAMFAWPMHSKKGYWGN